MEIHAVEGRSREACADLLSAALQEDRGWCTVVPDDRHRRIALRAVLGAAVRHAGHHARTAVVDGEPAAVAVWQPPGHHPPRGVAAVRLLPSLAPLLRLGGTAKRVMVFGAEVDRHVPPDAWYLQVLGVRADLRGRGIGSALVDDGCAVAGAAGRAVYLETSDADNVRLYRRHGFAVLDGGAPGGVDRWWRMLRPPP